MMMNIRNQLNGVENMKIEWVEKDELIKSFENMKMKDLDMMIECLMAEGSLGDNEIDEIRVYDGDNLILTLKDEDGDFDTYAENILDFESEEYLMSISN
jgi:hypothetical protein